MKELLERWIELLAQSGSNTKKQVREEMEEVLEEIKNDKTIENRQSNLFIR